MRNHLLFLLLFFSFNAFSQDISFEYGTRGSYFIQEGSYDNALNFFHFNLRREIFLESSTFKSNLKFRVFDPISSNEEVFIDPVNVSAELLFNKVAFQAGFIRYRFSETFGLQILDVANPRDYSDFVLNDLSWAKRSVFGINMQNQWDRLEALWMLTIWPNGDRLPYKGSPFDLTDGNFGYEGGVVERPWFKDYEYGLRLKYLFENGLDLSFLGYRHHARPTLLSLSSTGIGTFKVKKQDRLVTSLGMAASYVMDEWVIRGDALYTFKDNFQTGPLSFKEKNHFQHLIGVDRLWNEWSFGVQLQNDFAYRRNFLGVKVQNTHFEYWHPSVMTFVSESNSDQWFQIKNNFQYKEWNAAVVFDFLNGEENSKGLFGPYKNNDRILLELSHSL